MFVHARSHQAPGVDLNLGCPQRIASRSGYGAFLMAFPDTVEKVVRTMSEGLQVPVTCKIRVLPSVAETVRFAQMLQRAGCQLLTVHGRTKVIGRQSLISILRYCLARRI
jgi:tRNA-dihydrouridine synthase 1